MALSDVVRQSADALGRAARELEGGLDRFRQQAERMRQGTARTQGLPVPASAGGAASGVMGTASGAFLGASLARGIVPGRVGLPGGASLPGGAGAVAVAGTTGGSTALQVYEAQVVRAARATAGFAMMLERALSHARPALGGTPPGVPPTSGLPRLAGPGGGPLVPLAPPRVRVLSAGMNVPDVLPAGPTQGLWQRLSQGVLEARAAFAGLVPVVGAAVLAGRQLSNTFMGLAAKANPSAMATYQGSWDLLAARVGRLFVPALEHAARALQDLAQGADNIPKQWRGFSRNAPGNWAAIREWMGNRFGTAGTVGGFTPYAAFAGVAAAGLGIEIPGARRDMLRRFATPWEGGFGTGEQFRETLQSAGLRQDQLEREIMREQLEATREWLGIAKGIAEDVRNLRNFVPNFR